MKLKKIGKNNKVIMKMVRFSGLFCYAAYISIIIHAIVFFSENNDYTPFTWLYIPVFMIITSLITAPLSAITTGLFYFFRINRYALGSIIEPILLGIIYWFVYVYFDEFTSVIERCLPFLGSYESSPIPYLIIIPQMLLSMILLVQGGIIHLYHFIRNKRAEKNDQAANPNI